MVSYFDETLQALSASNTYVSPAAAASTPIDVSSIKQAIGNQDIAVVILPASASGEVTSLPNFARNVASSTNYDTVLVVVGEDFEAVSNALPPGKASELANQVETDYSGISDATQQFITEVGTQSKIQDEADNPPVTEFAIGGIIVAALVGVAIFGIKKSRQKRNTEKQQQRYSLETIRQSIFDIGSLSHNVTDHTLGTNIRDCLRQMSTLLDDVKASPDAIIQMRLDYEQPLEDYYQLLVGHIRVQNSGAYDPKKRAEILSVLEASTKSLSDAASDQHRVIMDSSLEEYIAAAQNLDLRFPQNFLNGR